MTIQNITNGETFYVGDEFAGVLVRAEIRNGQQVWVAASVTGVTREEAGTATRIAEGEVFNVDGKPYWVFEFDQEEGYPVICVAPRTLVG